MSVIKILVAVLVGYICYLLIKLKHYWVKGGAIVFILAWLIMFISKLINNPSIALQTFDDSIGKILYPNWIPYWLITFAVGAILGWLYGKIKKPTAA